MMEQTDAPAYEVMAHYQALDEAKGLKPTTKDKSQKEIPLWLGIGCVVLFFAIIFIL